MPVLLSSWAEWNFYFLCLVVVAVGAVAAMGGRVRGQAFCVLLFTGSTATEGPPGGGFGSGSWFLSFLANSSRFQEK